MNTKRSKLLFASTLSVVLGGVGLAPVIGKVIAQTASCKESPTVTLTRTIETASDYSVWVLLKNEGPATAAVSIDGGVCRELAAPTNGDWQWVEGKNGDIRMSFGEGDHTFAFSATSGTILFDKVLVTNDSACVPVADGSNCFVEPLEILVNGINDGDRIIGARKVNTIINSAPIAMVTVKYYLDEVLVRETSTEPYCLAGNQSPCDDFNFDTLENGEHTLRVEAVSGEKTDIVSRTFMIQDEAVPTPEEPVEVPNIGGNENPPASANPDITVQLGGIVANETVSGPKVLSATLANVTAGGSVRFILNGETIATDYEAPFCAVAGSGQTCGVWDSATIPNGSYSLQVIAAATGFKTTTETINFTVANTVPTTSAPVQPTTPTVVVGAPKQQVTGVTKVTVPPKQAQPNTKITYRIDDKVVGSATGTNPTAIIDTSEVSNGTKPITATIEKTNGQVDVLGGEVQVRNDALTASTNWFRENAVLFAVILMGSAVGIFFLVRMLVYRVRLNRLMDVHNLEGSYTYVQPQEQALQQQMVHGFAAVAVLFLGVFAIMRAGTLQAAVGFGFVAEIEEEGIGDFTYDYNEDMTIRYAKVTYVMPTPPAAPPATPPTTPPVTPPATPPTTPPSNGGSTVMHPTSGGFPTHNLPLIRPAMGSTSRLIGSSEFTILQNGDGGANPGTGAFRTWCYLSHFAYDDPLVKPDQPGASHLHMFFGNTSINAFTKETKTDAASTCRGGRANQSGYWVPAVIDTQGRIVKPDAILVYYKTGYGVSKDLVTTPPAGLRMIAGDAMATGDTGPVHFTCLRSGQIYRPVALGDCYAGQTQEISIEFPQCWDGVNLRSSNNKSHMTYLNWGSGCPASHPVLIPNITMNLYFATALNELGSTNGWRFVTDNYASSQGGWSMHGDWWNGWDQDVITRIVNDCLKRGVDCQTDELGDQQSALYCERGRLSPDDNGFANYPWFCR